MRRIINIFTAYIVILNACNTKTYNSPIIDSFGNNDSVIIPIDTTNLDNDTDFTDTTSSKTYIYLEYENDDFTFYPHEDKMIFSKDSIFFSYYIKHNNSAFLSSKEMHNGDRYRVCYDIFNKSKDTLYFKYDNSNVGSCYNENNDFIPVLSEMISLDTLPPEYIIIYPYDSCLMSYSYEIAFEEYAVGVHPGNFYYRAPAKYRHLEINDTIFTICYKPDIKLWFKIIE